MRGPAAAVAAVAAALAAGCGGGGGSGSLPAGAAMAPAGVPAFVSLKTDPRSSQSKRASRLARRFPALARELRRLERHRDAVGNELDVVWLDVANGGNDVVLLTKPRKLARVKTLLQPDGGSYSTLAEGWIVVADSRALVGRFKREAAGDKLDGERAFRDGFGKLDRGAAARAWVRGSTVQSALDSELARQGAAPRVTHAAGDLKAIAATAKPAAEGVRIDAYGLIDPQPRVAGYEPALQDAVPAGALLYVSTAALDRPTRLILRMVAAGKPDFERQLAQVESVLDIDLEQDVYPLLEGESALAIYRGRPVPRALFLQRVGDEAKADGLLRRVAAVAQLSGSARAETLDVAGTTVQKVTLGGSTVSVYAGVARGRLFVADTAALARDAIRGPATALADDPLFRAAKRAARPPSRVAALAYGDLRDGLPFALALARRGGGTITPRTVANTKPLRHALVYLEDGAGLRLSGFTAIK